MIVNIMFFNKAFFTLLMLGAAIFFTKEANCSTLRLGENDSALSYLQGSDDAVVSEFSIANALRRLINSPTRALHNDVQASTVGSQSAAMHSKDEDSSLDLANKSDAMDNDDDHLVEDQATRRHIYRLMRYAPTPITDFVRETYILRYIVLTALRFMMFFQVFLPKSLIIPFRYFLHALA